MFGGGLSGNASNLINGRYFDKLSQYYSLKGSNDSTLLFESRFESGNLHRATQVQEFEYDLELSSLMQFGIKMQPLTMKTGCINK